MEVYDYIFFSYKLQISLFSSFSCFSCTKKKKKLEEI